MNLALLIVLLIMGLVILIVTQVWNKKSYFTPEYQISSQPTKWNLKSQTAMIFTPGRTFAIEREGKVRMSDHPGEWIEIYDVKKEEKDFQDDNWEEGLMGIAVFLSLPDIIYLSFTVKGKDESHDTSLIVKKYQFSPSERKLKPIIQIFSQDFTKQYHHAGTLAFDSQGRLYLSTGDGGPQGDPGNYAQNLDSYRGKILRLDDTQDPKIVAYGLRNPWKFSIDHSDLSSNRIFVNDVGLNELESIYLIPDLDPKEPYNLGWNFFEGSLKRKDGLKYSDTLHPIFEYKNSKEWGNATTGGYYSPTRGVYITSDYTGKIYLLKPDDKEKWILVGKFEMPDEEKILSLAQDLQDNIYVLGRKDIYILEIQNQNPQ